MRRPRVLFVGRTRYRLPLSPSLARKFSALGGEIAAWVETRRLGRGWLHHRNTYDALLIFLGFPMTSWGTWHIYSAWIQGSAIERSGIVPVVVIWVFLSLLYVFRLLFAAAKWLWPTS